METKGAAALQTALIIDGRWQPSASERYYEVRNPARPDEIVGHAARATPEDVARAIEAAHQAFPAWSALSYSERGEYLKRISDHLVADQEELETRIRLFTREHGKILRESRLEMTRLGDRFDYCASLAQRLSGDEELHAPPFDTIITRQARGVALLIIPWNWPLSILGGKLPQALIAGNTVVIKPAQQSPLAPSLTIRRIAEMLPPGVVNLVTGNSSEIGDALLSHPLVRKINFTGGTETGRHIMRVAARHITPVTLELGGNDPAIVLEDVKLDEGAFRRMILGGFLTAGQVCMAIKRIYVHSSRYRELVEGFTEGLSRHVIGDGLEPSVTMGPLNNRKQLEIVRELIQDARDRGAQVHEVGSVADQELFEEGYFHRPCVVLGADHSHRVVVEEQFGPVMPILPFDTEEQAVRMANDTSFGLCSSVWTEDRERALRIARRLEAGYTYLNAHGPMVQDNRAPFGGFKESGIGRNLGFEGVLEFLESHSISAPAGWFFSKTGAVEFRP